MNRLKGLTKQELKTALRSQSITLEGLTYEVEKGTELLNLRAEVISKLTSELKSARESLKAQAKLLESRTSEWHKSESRIAALEETQKSARLLGIQRASESLQERLDASKRTEASLRNDLLSARAARASATIQLRRKNDTIDQLRKALQAVLATKVRGLVNSETAGLLRDAGAVWNGSEWSHPGAAQDEEEGQVYSGSASRGIPSKLPSAAQVEQVRGGEPSGELREVHQVWAQGVHWIE